MPLLWWLNHIGVQSLMGLALLHAGFSHAHESDNVLLILVS